jgi:hypothetical protein
MVAERLELTGPDAEMVGAVPDEEIAILCAQDIVVDGSPDSGMQTRKLITFVEFYPISEPMPQYMRGDTRTSWCGY